MPPRADNHDPLLHKQVYTTGEAARICGLSQQTIIRSFDAGRIGGFKVPGSKFRRITREALLDFMRANSIPTTLIDPGSGCIIVLAPDHQRTTRLAATLHEAGFSARPAESPIHAGILLKDLRPAALLLDQSPFDTTALRRTLDDHSLTATRILSSDASTSPQAAARMVQAALRQA